MVDTTDYHKKTSGESRQHFHVPKAEIAVFLEALFPLSNRTVTAPQGKCRRFLADSQDNYLDISTKKEVIAGEETQWPQQAV